MELVGATVGGPWTDHPLCTPPVLAHVARTVNDHTSAWARPQLAPLIPYLITDPGHIDEDDADRATSLAVLAAAAEMLPVDLIGPLSEQLYRVADAAAARRHPWRRMLPDRHRHKVLAITDVALRAIHNATIPTSRDEQLRGLLVNVINAQRSVEGVRLITEPLSIPTDSTITVLSRLVKPPGADWLEVEVSTDPNRLPNWLSSTWHERQSELAAHRPVPGGPARSTAGL